MFHQRNTSEKPVINTIRVSGILAILLFLCFTFSACNRMQQLLSDQRGEDTLGGPVKIGFLHAIPLPGTTRNGAELAVTQLNAEGGVNGTPIQLIVRDYEFDAAPSSTQPDAARSAELATELIVQEEVLALVGPDWTRHAVEVVPVAAQHEIPMVTTYPTNPSVPEPSEFVFMASFTDIFQGELAAKFAVDSLGATTVAILAEKGEAYSEGLSQYFTDSFTARGGTVLTQQFYKHGDTDFSTQLTAIAEVEPDVVFLPGLVWEVPFIVKQARADVGLTAPFLGGDGWDAPTLISDGGAALEGSFFVNHFSASPTEKLENAESHQFVTAYQQMFGKLPDGPASVGYDAVRVLVQAMRRAETLTNEAIREQLAATMDYSGAMQILHYNENRHAIKNGVINVIEDGKIQLYQIIRP